MVIGAQVGRAGHFSVNYRKDTWSIGVLLLEISASDDFGRNRFPNKHLILHTFDIRPFPNLELGVFESVVWGGRFEFLYMAPFNQYFAAQSLTGFEDNSLVGVHGRWTAAKDLQVLGQVYVDDLHFNDMVRLKLDTKYKFAAELGLRWAPERGPLADLRADYTAIMPYMYSHITDPREGPNSARYIANKPNFYNYSHMGRSLGSDLKPNSDRLSFGSDWRLLPGLELGLSAYLTRHGNASEGVAGINNYIWHDGSYLDDGYSDPPVSQSDTIKPYGPQMTFERMTNFLNQRVIETKAAAGFDLDWSYPTSLGIITAQAGYTLEYGWNRGLSDGNNGIVHFWNVGGGWRW
jgi:hypothetical protein